LSIVAVTSILGSIVEDLVGDNADVIVLIGPGVDPHSYQVSARDGQLLRDADLVVANGPLDDVPLEEGLFDLLTTVRSEGIAVFDFVANSNPLFFATHGDDDDDHGHEDDDDHGLKDDDHGDDDGAHEDDDDHGHDADAHGDIDPHFWWDLSRVADAVVQLAAAIAAVDTERAEEFWVERASVVAQIYRDLDDEIVQSVSVLTDEQRIIVTNHDSFGYLADRYGFTVRDTVIPGYTTDAQTNPRAFAQLIDVLVDEEIRVIFAGNTDSTRLAEQLRTQATAQGLDNVTVVQLYTDALGPAGSGAETYVAMVRTTVDLIVEALG